MATLAITIRTAENTFTKPFSEETGKMIDEEVRKMIDISYERTKALLIDKREQVEKLAKELLTKEVLFKSDVEELIGKRPYEEKRLLEDDDSSNREKGTIDEGVPPYDSSLKTPNLA